MGFKAVALAAAVLALSLPARAGDIAVERAWARATPGGAAVAAGYLTVTNRGAAPDRLLGGSFAESAGFEVHETTRDGGVMRMRPAGPLAVPPGGTLVLAPGAAHVMFTGLKRPLRAGETVPGTLRFERAGAVPVVFSVEPVGARGPATPGMDMGE